MSAILFPSPAIFHHRVDILATPGIIRGTSGLINCIQLPARRFLLREVFSVIVTELKVTIVAADFSV